MEAYKLWQAGQVHYARMPQLYLASNVNSEVKISKRTLAFPCISTAPWYEYLS